MDADLHENHRNGEEPDSCWKCLLELTEAQARRAVLNIQECWVGSESPVYRGTPKEGIWTESRAQR